MGKMKTEHEEIQARYAGEPMRVRHADLQRHDDSPFRSIAPCCGGLLLVRRDPETFLLMRDDNCVKCGQRFRYTDASISGERFLPEPN